MKNHSTAVRNNFVRICKIHVLIALAGIIQLIIYDASKLITPDVLLKRWIAVSILVITAGTCWYVTRLRQGTTYLPRAAAALIAVDIALAAFSVYTQRGMASRAVFLFVIPILVAAVFRRKGAIYLTALISATTYLATAVAYFVLNFNEGYKVELYGEIGFYSAMLFAVGGLAWILAKENPSS